MLNEIIERTNLYIEAMPKSKRKSFGQFFTSKETAVYMANMFNIPKQDTLSILDPGTGSGILSVALIERIQMEKRVKVINLTCYENNADVLSLLNDNLQYIKENADIKIFYEIIDDNYITSQYLDFNNMIGQNPNPPKYDLIIGNPPYLKIPKDAPEATAMPLVCYGAPNLYFLFSSMSLFNLKNDGEMVYIIPRSWTSGAYFRRFREYFLSNGSLQHIHLFVSRDKVFDKEQVLQETIIIKVKKSYKKPDFITISTTETNYDFHDIKSLNVPYDLVLSGKDNYIYLITDEKDKDTLAKINKYHQIMPDIGIKMKTGLTVDFRSYDMLFDEPIDGSYPIYYSQHIKDGKIIFPLSTKNNQYIKTEKNGLLQKNKNYLFVKRFTSKEEKRRLQCGIYLVKEHPNSEFMSTQNKLNFIDGLGFDLSEDAVFGLYCLFNSTLYDNYYRILNGSTQVNSTEINNIPIPSLKLIEEIGVKLKERGSLTEDDCNEILEVYY